MLIRLVKYDNMPDAGQYVSEIVEYEVSEDRSNRRKLIAEIHKALDDMADDMACSISIEKM